ncbi:S-adenosyl-L-methionine-dependent methyltransferase [Gymnopus androsaceus JB14]|uniref:S-adenosyl-L-methionine-dependent methyltransferase n=1 Tax=Gymnopus androsaceus JB14 TaxID=1447944 RepID=A0A6A4HGL6_9AGAR|nr:S-adenosyl-L-methionine-dependent methyltransferase [Gymnopus androsaceus JB14]
MLSSPSQEYLLPSDKRETGRLNLQHRIIVKAFNQLALAPLSLKAGDRVLESGAGSGIWALEFCEQNRKESIPLNVQCIDLSPDQFPLQYPPEIQFSLYSITDLPANWSDTFVYVHQRLLVAALNPSQWKEAINQIFRVLRAGGWAEFVESPTKVRHFGVGPNSKQLVRLGDLLYKEKDRVGDLEDYLPSILKGAGFVDIHRESRDVPISASIEDGLDRVQQWYDLWKGMKGAILAAGGYGIVKTEAEYESLLLGCREEWMESKDAYTTYWTIIARKPRGLRTLAV